MSFAYLATNGERRETLKEFLDNTGEDEHQLGAVLARAGLTIEDVIESRFKTGAGIRQCRLVVAEHQEAEERRNIAYLFRLAKKIELNNVTYLAQPGKVGDV